MSTPNDQSLAPAIPITHQSHPFWAGFSWTTLLKVLSVAAAAAPVIVAASTNDPVTNAKATALSNLTGLLATAELQSENQSSQ
jgi:hypothetical protein